jgi:hypothetical protein
MGPRLLKVTRAGACVSSTTLIVADTQKRTIPKRSRRARKGLRRPSMAA